MNFVPFHDWVLLEIEPVQKKSTLLELPTNESAVRVGRVVKMGPGKEGQVMDIQVGQRLAFFRWNQEHQAGKAVHHVLSDISENLVVVRQTDVLFEVLEDLQMDIP